MAFQAPDSPFVSQTLPTSGAHGPALAAESLRSLANLIDTSVRKAQDMAMASSRATALTGQQDEATTAQIQHIMSTNDLLIQLGNAIHTHRDTFTAQDADAVNRIIAETARTGQAPFAAMMALRNSIDSRVADSGGRAVQTPVQQADLTADQAAAELARLTGFEYQNGMRFDQGTQLGNPISMLNGGIATMERKVADLTTTARQAAALTGEFDQPTMLKIQQFQSSINTMKSLGGVLQAHASKLTAADADAVTSILMDVSLTGQVPTSKVNALLVSLKTR